MTRPLLIAGAASVAVLLAGAFIGGRCSRAPARVEERTVTDGKRDASWGSTSTMAKRVETKRAPSVRERFDPAGHIVERLTLGELVTTTAVEGVRTTTAEVHEVVRVETVRITEPVSPRLRLRLGAEWRSADLHLQPVINAGADVRVVGPLWLSATISPPILGQPLDVRFGPTLVLQW